MSKADDELFELKSSRTGEYLHSKSADEMFEELGYKKSLHTNIKEEVWGECFTNENKYVEIHFDYIDKEICECAISGDSGVYIGMQELQAINKKCEELGWLDDN